MDIASIGQHHVETNDGIERKSPGTRAVAVTAMSGMSTNANARTGSVRKRSLGLVVDGLGEVAQPDAPANLRNVFGVQGDGLKVLKVNDHTPALAAQGEGSVGMATTSRLHFDIVFGGTCHGIGDVLGCFWKDNDGRGVGKTEVVGLRQLGEVGRGCQTDGHIFAAQTVTESAGSGSGGRRGSFGGCGGRSGLTGTGSKG